MCVRERERERRERQRARERGSERERKGEEGREAEQGRERGIRESGVGFAVWGLELRVEWEPQSPPSSIIDICTCRSCS